MMKKLYAVLAALIVLGYGWASYRGLEFQQTKKGMTTKGVRGAHGGTRPFWVGGYRGGK